MEKSLTYKGFVCLNTDIGISHTLIIKIDKIFQTIPIIGNEEEFKDITSNSMFIVGVKFFDGTEQVDLDYALKSDFDDVLISVYRCISVEMFEITDIFHEISRSYKETLELWTLVDKYFNTESGIENFNEFVNRKQF